jgi:ankyrin repeat protein
VELLVSHGAPLKDVNFSSICTAAKEGHLDILQWLVKQGADMDDTFYDEMTLVELAAEGGHLDVVQWLVSQGSDVFMVNPYNLQNLLHLAAQNGNINLCMWLLSQGLDINQTLGGETPLCLAVKARNLEAVRFLLLNHADPTISPEDEGTLLECALRHYTGLGYRRDMGRRKERVCKEIIKILKAHIKK